MIGGPMDGGRPRGRDEDAGADDDAAQLDEHLEAAYDALEADQPEQALAEAAASPDAAGRALVECRAHLGLGMLRAAEGSLRRAAEALGEDHLDVVELTGELALAAWDLGTARRAFERLLADEGDDPLVLERLALLADLDEDQDAADALMDRARAAEEDAPPPVRVSDEVFDAAVEDALAGLRAPFRAPVERCRIVREPVPFRELIDPSDPGATPPDILGLFVGATLQDGQGEADLPPTIYLFKRNLERGVLDEDELAEEIRITLFHEIGHLLGLDEDEVAGMGLA